MKVGETVQLTAIVAPDNASQEVLWVSDAEGIASVDSATGLVTANSAGTAIITATSTMNPEKKAQCTVVVTRDDTALDVAIKAAEEKIREENFENKYTEASKTALRENLENAKLAKENANLSVEDVKLVVDALNASIEELQLKAVVTINNNDQIETKYCEIRRTGESCCTDCERQEVLTLDIQWNSYLLFESVYFHSIWRYNDRSGLCRCWRRSNSAGSYVVQRVIQ